MTAGVTYLVRCTWRNGDGLDEQRAVEAPDLDGAHAIARRWAADERRHHPPRAAVAIVIAHQRDGCTIQTDDVPILRPADDRRPPTAADSIRRARQALADAAERRPYGGRNL